MELRRAEKKYRAELRKVVSRIEFSHVRRNKKLRSHWQRTEIPFVVHDCQNRLSTIVYDFTSENHFVSITYKSQGPVSFVAVFVRIHYPCQPSSPLPSNYTNSENVRGDWKARILQADDSLDPLPAHVFFRLSRPWENWLQREIANSRETFTTRWIPNGSNFRGFRNSRRARTSFSPVQFSKRESY